MSSEHGLLSPIPALQVPYLHQRSTQHSGNPEEHDSVCVCVCVFVCLTGSASPAGDVTGVVVGQDLSRGGQGGQLDLGVESSIRGQAQQSDVPPEEDRKEL